MAQFIEFASNHWILSGLWLLTVTALLLHFQSKASKAVSPQQAVHLINRSEGVVVDVREKKDFEKGHIVDSINIPLAKLSQRVTELEKFKERPIVVVCKLGQQSGEACKKLQQAGYSQVYKLAGGVTDWKAKSLPLIQK